MIQSRLLSILLLCIIPASVMSFPQGDLTLIRLQKDERDPIAEEIFRDSLSGSASDALYGAHIETHILQLKNATVGFITCQDLYEGTIISRHIPHLAVIQHLRRKGLATFMIHEIEKMALEKKIALIEIPYEEDDALICYKKLGYTEDPMNPCTVMKELSGSIYSRSY